MSGRRTRTVALAILALAAAAVPVAMSVGRHETPASARDLPASLIRGPVVDASTLRGGPVVQAPEPGEVSMEVPPGTEIGAPAGSRPAAPPAVSRESPPGTQRGGGVPRPEQ